MTRPDRYPAEIRERAVRMVLEHEAEHTSQWAAITSIASKFGMTPETLRIWVRRAEVDGGARPGLITEERERLRELERENRELRRANEILKAADVNSSGQCNTIRKMTEVCSGELGPTGNVGCEAGTALAAVGGWAVVQRDLACDRSPARVDLHRHRADRRIRTCAAATSGGIVDACGA